MAKAMRAKAMRAMAMRATRSMAARGRPPAMAKASTAKAPAKPRGSAAMAKSLGAPLVAPKPTLPVDSPMKRAYKRRAKTSALSPDASSPKATAHPGPTASSGTIGTWTLQLTGPGHLPAIAASSNPSLGAKL